MSRRNDDPFDRQLSREYERLAGPEPRFDVRDVVQHASGAGSRRRSWFGSMLLPATLAVTVAALGILAMVSGLFDPPDDAAVVGASPSPTAGLVLQTEAPEATKVYYATGTFAEEDIDWDRLESLIEAGQFSQPPDYYADDGSGELSLYVVTSSDSSLSGEAVVFGNGGWWEHTVTVDDIDDPLPNGLWSLGSQHGRLEIRNAAGVWEGPIGPVFGAQGEDPPDGVPGNAPSLEGRVPAVLRGSGAYAGMTAYVSFLEPDSGDRDDRLIDNGDFEAVIINAAPAAEVGDRAWTEALEWAQEVRDGGFAE